MHRVPVILLGVLGLGLMPFSGQDPTAYQFPAIPHFPAIPLDTDGPPTIAQVALGRSLFYDPMLSGDERIACSSCHRQEHAFSDAGKALSATAGHATTRRNAPALFNLAWHPAYFWDGRAKTLEEQAALTMTGAEMNADMDMVVEKLRGQPHYRRLFERAFGPDAVDSTHLVRALAQFERTLISHRSKYDSVLLGRAKFSADEYAGFVLVNDQSMADCLHCHTTDADVLGSTFQFSNNGLDPGPAGNEFADKGRWEVSGRTQDISRFKIPSLRNVALTAPYMHDGRFSTLEEVVDHYSTGLHSGPHVDSRMQYAHQGGVQLTVREKEQIIAFLHTLTDSAFVSDPAFSDPPTSAAKRKH